MTAIMESTSIVSKIQDLCAALVEDESIKQHNANIDAFLENDGAKAAYEEVSNLGGQLQQMQQAGQELKAEEVEAFENKREALFENEVVTTFLESQKALQEVHTMVGAWVGKTLELGEVPSEEDIKEAQGGGCCGGDGGGSCGC